MLRGRARPSRNLDLASFLVLPPASPAIPGNTATLWDSGLEQGGLQTMARDEIMFQFGQSFPGYVSVF